MDKRGRYKRTLTSPRATSGLFTRGDRVTIKRLGWKAGHIGEVYRIHARAMRPIVRIISSPKHSLYLPDTIHTMMHYELAKG